MNPLTGFTHLLKLIKIKLPLGDLYHKSSALFKCLVQAPWKNVWHDRFKSASVVARVVGCREETRAYQALIYELGCRKFKKFNSPRQQFACRAVWDVTGKYFFIVADKLVNEWIHRTTGCELKFPFVVLIEGVFNKQSNVCCKQQLKLKSSDQIINYRWSRMWWLKKAH